MVLVAAVALAACSSGSTNVTTEETGPTAPTGPTATAPTGPTATGATGETGTATGSDTAAILGEWEGQWHSDTAPVSGRFTMTFEPTPEGFAGTIRIFDSVCVSNGTVEGTVEGDRITFGAVQAEEEITFEGRIDGDEMSGTYDSPAPECGPDTGTWEAARTG
jgi:hypothetical protein